MIFIKIRIIHVLKWSGLQEPTMRGATFQQEMNRYESDGRNDFVSKAFYCQINAVTHFIDGSLIFGSDQSTWESLKSHDGCLKTQTIDDLQYMPNTDDLEVCNLAPSDCRYCFRAGTLKFYIPSDDLDEFWLQATVE